MPTLSLSLSHTHTCIHTHLHTTVHTLCNVQVAVGMKIVRSEGFGALYRGLSAGLLRQATYTTARLGIFNNFSRMLSEYNEGKPIPLYQKALAGLSAGGMGALVGTPADLTLIRMQVRLAPWPPAVGKMQLDDCGGEHVHPLIRIT